MPNWCRSSIAFYQEDGGNAMIDAFFADVQKYQDYKVPESGKASDWVGHWLQSNRIDTDNIYSRGFFTDCELHADHVRVDMETAWAPLTEVWDLMAEKYNLSYVYIADEPGCEVYVNTDSAGRFFTTRYMINYFDVDDLELDVGTMAEFGERLRRIGGKATYFASWEEVEFEFKGFGFKVVDLESLNKRLAVFGIRVYEYNVE